MVLINKEVLKLAINLLDLEFNTKFSRYGTWDDFR